MFCSAVVCLEFEMCLFSFYSDNTAVFWMSVCLESYQKLVINVF